MSSKEDDNRKPKGGFKGFPEVQDRRSGRSLTDDDVRWLVLWVTQLAKRYMSNEELPESITSAIESLHTMALGLWREGKLANSKENSIIALETIRRTLLRREVLTAPRSRRFAVRV